MSPGFEGELLTHLLCVFYNVCRGSRSVLRSAPDWGVYVIARCETELTRTPELLLTSIWDVDVAMFLEGQTLKHLDRPLVVG